MKVYESLQHRTDRRREEEEKKKDICMFAFVRFLFMAIKGVAMNH